ncbi:ABC transporter substrate-binding protein [Arenibaculum sp.]|jgi:ABC-type nitrate/sulfonate/bicarbonate transport system substrate-binding protein|uniref:ABC transporter substrate-binding protein n=1 Tax=Arenibaculum sp. TaxID=2865862 RepID=UPI002E168975|nr:ABC transporter substrate-binding protein [Arenibaculum sp.]
MKTFRTVAARLSLATAITAGAFAATAQPAQAQPTKTETVRVAMLAPSALLWLHAIAEDQGFYAERGLEIEELRAASSPALLQAVASGSVEAGVSLGDLVVRAVDQGAPIVISGAILEKTILRLVGGPGIDSAADLSGKVVTAGGVTGGTANLLLYQLQKAGVKAGDVQMVALTNSRDRVVALGNGQVSGALLIAPFDTIAMNDGMAVLDVYTEPYVQTPLILNKDWAAQNPDTAADLTQALQEASNWIYEPANREKAVAILADYTGVEPDVAEASYRFIIEEQQAIGRNLEMPDAALQNIVDIDAALTGEPAPTLDVSKYYDPGYLAGR